MKVAAIAPCAWIVTFDHSLVDSSQPNYKRMVLNLCGSSKLKGILIQIRREHE